MTMADIVRINAYVIAAEYLGGYMKVRDEFVGSPPPASTLMIVQGFSRPEFKVEIEAVAARAGVGLEDEAIEHVPSKFWSDRSWRDFAAADMSQYIAVLPVAATEQHGPHLPVGVDTFINQGYLARAIALTPDDMPALYLPVQAIGKSNEHIEFPGTLTFSHETIIRAWTEIGDSVARDGLPQAGVHQFARRQRPGDRHRRARTARADSDMLAVHAAWHRLGLPEGMFRPRSARMAFTAATSRPR